MVYCFAPTCSHSSESHTCKFFAFPSDKKENEEYKRWIRLIRRKDREPSKHSRVCSCHFTDGYKQYGPTIYERNRDKIFPSEGGPPKKKKKVTAEKKTVKEMVAEAIRGSEQQPTDNDIKQECCNKTTNEIILEAELDQAREELQDRQEKESYAQKHYNVSGLSAEVLRMETGLPTKDVFNIVVLHALGFKDCIVYYSGWRVESINFEDQIFITLMKLRQNYTNLHLAQLFSCSVATIANIVTTFIHVLHSILFRDIMTTIPSREKNVLCAPSSFSEFTSCRIVIDCTDVEIAAPGLMSQQNATYSSYRGMNSFKVIVGVAPNAVITFVSKLYPGSISDKAIVQQSGLLNHLVAGDMVLADKGFLIQDILPNDVSLNIPPFFNNGVFTESEAKKTKSIARARIHVERANARLKDFKILTFIPYYLKCYADVIFQLCAALVNLQFPLIKEGCEGTEFE
ncbi:uncharacterized protein [Montipora foliosa]|uniref:uncharacterized protein n=1 Tax=Montipora foliosa TaxID=591990 RepID=UPI0035F10B5F